MGGKFMKIYTIDDNDIICAQSNIEGFAESFYQDDWDVLEPIQKMKRIDSAREYLFSQNVPRTPNVAGYIVTRGRDFNNTTRALFFAYKKNMMDKRYITRLMEYVVSAGRPISKEEMGYIAVLGSWVFDDIYKDKQAKIDELTKLVPDKVKKEKEGANETDKKIEEINAEFDEKTGPLLKLIYDLILPIINRVKAIFPEMENSKAIPIASALCCQNRFTIYQLLDGDCAMSSQVLDIIDNKHDFVGEILKIDKNEFNKRYPKLTGNQERFWDSVKTWVYKQLENYATASGHSNTDLLAYLNGVYGLIDKDTLMINLRTIPSQYPTLLECGRALFNK